MQAAKEERMGMQRVEIDFVKKRALIPIL